MSKNKITGTKTEVKEVVIEVSDKELMKVIRERTGVGNYILNDKKDEIGHWYCDDGGGYYEHEPDVWKCISKDEKKVEVLKAIEVIETYMRKNK